MGIGTTDPQATLDLQGDARFQGFVDVQGPLRIRSGFPAQGRVLTSDAEGRAIWQEPPGPPFIVRQETMPGKHPADKHVWHGRLPQGWYGACHDTQGTVYVFCQRATSP